MSEENRRKEYNRLVKLGRLVDIPENLTSEFGKVPGPGSKSLPDKDKARATPQTKPEKVKNGK